MPLWTNTCSNAHLQQEEVHFVCNSPQSKVECPAMDPFLVAMRFPIGNRSHNRIQVRIRNLVLIATTVAVRVIRVIRVLCGRSSAYRLSAHLARLRARCLFICGLSSANWHFTPLIKVIIIIIRQRIPAVHPANPPNPTNWAIRGRKSCSQGRNTARRRQRRQWKAIAGAYQGAL